MPLNPQHLTPTASLNRVVVSSPNPKLHGKTGYELVSAEAMMRLVQQHGSYPPADAYMAWILLDAGLVIGEAFAEPVIQGLGAGLATLLNTLLTGPDYSRQARPEWDESYWQHWGQVQRVILGGGVVSGNIGLPLVRETLRLVERPDFELICPPIAPFLPLVGLARLAPAGSNEAFMVDCGGSRIKAAYATYEKNRLVKLSILPELPSYPTDTPQQLLAYMVEIMKAFWHGGAIMLSVAAYVDADGQPYPTQRGLYAQLNEVTPTLQIESGTRMGVGVRVLHDGTAAALAYAGEPNTAVIMLGTALGSGFPPPNTSGLMHLDFSKLYIEEVS